MFLYCSIFLFKYVIARFPFTALSQRSDYVPISIKLLSTLACDSFLVTRKCNAINSVVINCTFFLYKKSIFDKLKLQ